MVNAGRLPRPRAEPSAAARRLLELYDRHDADVNDREALALLQFEIPRASKQDLADYYAGLMLRRQGGS